MARVNTLWVAGFTADTPVLMADGKTKPISKIKEGERVVSFDPKTKALQPGKVVGTWSKVISEIMEVMVDDKSMIVAESQRFFTPNGEWKTAPDAEAVLGLDGLAKKISAKKAKGNAKIYDITVSGTHAFIADGIMVHNGGGGGGSSPPKPPPDPVVTAGKVGKPLSVVVNGNTITVPASPGSSGQVSVAHTGGVSTGYRATPGVPTSPINPIKPIVKNPRTPNYLTSYNYVVSASTTRDSVCADMSSNTGAVSGSDKSSWKNSLKSMRRDVSNAKKNDKNARGYGRFEVTNWIPEEPCRDGVIFSPGSDTMAVNGCRPFTRIRTVSQRGEIYDNVLDEIRDLDSYLNKNKNFTAKDIAFINGKCAELEGNLNSLKSSLNGNGGPIRIDDPDPHPDRIYSNEPGYGNYLTDDGYHYYFQPITTFGANALGVPGYYKHFDTDNGLFYYDKNADNAL